MWLQRGEVYDVNRMVVEFTMLNPGKVLLCVGTAAMHDLEGRRDVKPNQRADKFIRLREVIEGLPLDRRRIPFSRSIVGVAETLGHESR